MSNLRDTVTLRQWNFFTVLADQKNFSRASETVSVTQPALSAAIRQLETQLGVRLFHRSTHHVDLTADGTALLPYARRLLNSAEHTFEDMHHALQGQRARVRVGAAPSTMYLMGSAIAQMQQERFAAEFEISDGTSEVLLDELRSGMLDIALAVQYRPHDDLCSEPVLEDELVLVVHRSHRLASARTAAWRDLAGEEIVMFMHGSIGELTSSALRQNRLVPSQKYRVDQNEALYGLVRANLAVGIMPRLYISPFNHTELALVALIDPVITRHIALSCRLALREEHPLAAQAYAGLHAALGAAIAEHRRRNDARRR